MTAHRRRALWFAALLVLAACSGPGPEPEADEPWTPRPLTDVVFDRTPEREAHGEYLVNGVLRCFVCHSERDWSAPGAPPVAGREGAGFANWQPPRPDWLVAPNLTPDDETGIGTWTDDMLVRAIREGVSHDGRPLSSMMPFEYFGNMADEDLASVIVYLRSRPAVPNDLPDGTPPPTWDGYQDPPEPWTPRAFEWVADADVARGGYLAILGDCAGCHTSWHTPRNPGRFGGGNLVERAGISAFSSNLTTSPSGIPYFEAAMFRDVMRTGRVGGRELSPAMPWGRTRTENRTATTRSS